MAKMVMLRGSMKMEVDRREVKGIDTTPDGLVVFLKSGVRLYIDDPNMPAEVKNKVAMMDGANPEADVTYNLNNYTTPVSISG